MKRGAIIALSVVGVLAVVLVAAAAWLVVPTRAAAYEDPVPLESRMSNTDAGIGLARLGIQDHVIETDAERILVVYRLPEAYAGDVEREEIIQRMVLTTGASAAPQAAKVVAVQMSGDTVLRAWAMQLSDFEAYAKGEIDAATLDARIVRA